MSLKGQTGLVLGGTGVVGSGAVHQLLAEGAKVVVTSRSQEKFNELAARFPDAKDQLIGVIGTFDSKEQVEELYGKVKKALNGASPDHVVCTIGFASLTPTGILDADPNVLRSSFEESLYTSINAAKVILKDIKEKEGATYTVQSGGFAHKCFFPGAWPASIKNAAVNALISSLASDTEKSKVRVNGNCLHFSVALAGKTDNQMGMPAAANNIEYGRTFVRIIQKKELKGQLLCFGSKEEALAF